MEKEIIINPGDNLDAVVLRLLTEKARGEHAYCTFNGHVLHSDTITLNSAYQEVVGCSKAEYEQQMIDYNIKRDKRNSLYNKINSVISNRNRYITWPLVINGLKYIAENQNISQQELVNGLKSLGCTFTIIDVKKQFPKDIILLNGMLMGDISCGAIIIADVRDNEKSREYYYDRLLKNDDELSIYNYIRMVTGDMSYTKDHIASLSKENTIRK